MTTGHLLAIAWEFEPSIVVGCALLLVAHLAVVRTSSPRHTAWWTAGVVILLLDLCGPLDVLGDTYLFSAHMGEHLVLLLVVPLLLLLGVPENVARRALRVPWVDAAERVLSRPLLAWTIAVVTLWAWHVPALYDLTLINENIHILEHISFLVTATIFWWPVLTPVPERRMPALTAVVYLWTAMIANTILGVLLTFAPVPLYPGYLNPSDELGALDLIRNVWHLTPLADQQAGGVLMWVVGMFVFALASFAVMVRWYREPDLELEEA